MSIDQMKTNARVKELVREKEKEAKKREEDRRFHHHPLPGGNSVLDPRDRHRKYRKGGIHRSEPAQAVIQDFGYGVPGGTGSGTGTDRQSSQV